MSPLRPIDVALIITSISLGKSVKLEKVSLLLSNNRVKFFAFSTVRLAICSDFTCASSNGKIAPRVAPPAPKIATFASFNLTPCDNKSATKPRPSVLSPYSLPSLMARVLTAPAKRAYSDSSPRCWHSANAISLKGTVTFAPVPPPAKNASMTAVKLSTSLGQYWRW